MPELTKGQRTSLLLLALALAGLIYGFLIWPTPYVIIHEKNHVFRVNRFTGVRQESTEKGWMTAAELEIERKAKAEQKEATDKAKSESLLQDLKQIRIDDSRDDFNKIAIYNPTDWQLSNSSEIYYDTVIEYYRREGRRETFLCKAEVHNYFLKARTHNDVSLTSFSSEPPEVKNLAGGTSFIQRITITFDTATNVKGDSNDKYMKLQPAFVMKFERPWVSTATDRRISIDGSPLRRKAMRRCLILSTVLVSVTLINAGCDDRSAELAKKISGAHEHADKLQADIEDLKNHLADLKEQVDRFGDGSTNWREIVPEVESKTSDLETEIDGLNVQAEELASELNELEDMSAESEGDN